MVIVTTSQKDADLIIKTLRNPIDEEVVHPITTTAATTPTIYEEAIAAYLSKEAASPGGVGYVGLSYDTMLHVPAYNQPEVGR